MVSRKQIASDYDLFWADGLEPSDDWTQFGTRSLRMQAVHLLSHDGGLVLDIGCGNGLALGTLRRMGRRSLGCDISSRALHDARAYGDVVRADASCLPFRNERFHTILMLDALEHVIDKRTLMEECHRVLTDRGELVMTTPLPKATAGHGDHRQPYDQPATYPEIVDMTSHLFRLRAAKGIGWTPRGLSRLTRVVPKRVYATFPVFLENSTEVLLLLEKR